MPGSEGPTEERHRLAALHALRILDTAPEERFDRITRLAQRVFDAPVVMVTLIDEARQWHKSKVGPVPDELPLAMSFCKHAIEAGEDTVVIWDAMADERFSDNPLVKIEPGIRFYAGRPFAAPTGERLGTLCVIDSKSRTKDEFDVRALDDLAVMVEREIAHLTDAIVDELTGLSNRRGFDLLGGQVLSVAERVALSVNLVFIDVDDLKEINDAGGHEAGDKVLVKIARLLEEHLRDSDVIARRGGDEFCALLTGPQADDAQRAVERLAEAASREGIAFSFGISSSTAGTKATLEELVADADRLMYERKHANP